MEDTFIQMGARLRGLREVLDIPAQEVADLCHISLEQYSQIEEGVEAASMSMLGNIATHYGIDLDVLMFGEEPRMQGYFVTRHGQGMQVERRADYRYRALAAGFRHKRMNPYMVEVEPLPQGERRQPKNHNGQEFDMVMEGTLELTIGQRTLVLHQGDSIYFDSSRPHCMHALEGKPVKFLCIVD